MIKEDSVLIEESLSGTLNAYDELMHRYEKRVYNIAYGFGKNKENAMDITQNAFLKAYQNLDKYSARGSFKSWLMRITYNEGIDWVRKNKRFQKAELFDEDSIHEQQYPSQEDELLAKEHHVELLRSLFALNTRYRLAVVLRYFEELAVKDIAVTLDCSEGVVKNMLYRSLQRLRKELKGGYNERM